jgi:hypothetical protein
MRDEQRVDLAVLSTSVRDRSGKRRPLPGLSIHRFAVGRIEFRNTVATWLEKVALHVDDDERGVLEVDDPLTALPRCASRSDPTLPWTISLANSTPRVLNSRLI